METGIRKGIALAEFYNKDYFVGRVKSNYEDYHKMRGNDVVKARGMFIKEFFRPIRTLEIGCAMGFEVRWLRKHGVESYGIEASTYAVNESPDDVRRFITNGDVCSLLHAYNDNYFDVIYSYDVLEHIEREDLPELMAQLVRIGKFNYHRIATKEDPRDKDESHVTIEDIEWWRDQWPDMYLSGSEDPDDYAVNPPQAKPSLDLIQFFNAYVNRT